MPLGLKSFDYRIFDLLLFFCGELNKSKQKQVNKDNLLAKASNKKTNTIMCTEHLGYKRTFTRPYLFSFSFSLVTRNGGQNSRCLLSTHHGYPCVGPHVQETRAVKKTGLF